MGVQTSGRAGSFSRGDGLEVIPTVVHPPSCYPHRHPSAISPLSACRQRSTNNDPRTTTDDSRSSFASRAIRYYIDTASRASGVERSGRFIPRPLPVFRALPPVRSPSQSWFGSGEFSRRQMAARHLPHRIRSTLASATRRRQPGPRSFAQYTFPITPSNRIDMLNQSGRPRSVSIAFRDCGL